MATFRLEQSPKASDPKLVELTLEERKFLDYLVDHHGESWIETDHQQDWMGKLLLKLG